MDKIRIFADDYQDAGKIYSVHSAKRREGSTALELVLEDEEGTITYRTVAYHQVEWIEVIAV